MNFEKNQAMSEKECTFCKLAVAGSPFVYENEYFFVRFDRYPVSPGHALVIPKRHVVSLLELSVDEWIAVSDALHNAIIAIETTDLVSLYEGFLGEAGDEKALSYANKMLCNPFIKKRPDGYNIGNNEGSAAGRTIHHLHIHIIPRYTGDVDNPVGGIRNIIQFIGNYRE
ncbi:MAG: HIT domain-containing protein [Negativicutes bacterium]